MKRHAFVYGTLRKGDYNHYLIEGRKFVGKGEVHGEMYSVGSFPVAVNLETSEKKFVVECYEITPLLELTLDRLELPHGYKKKQITVDVEGVGKVDGIIYYQEHWDSGEQMPIYDWTKYRRRTVCQRI